MPVQSMFTTYFQYFVKMIYYPSRAPKDLPTLPTGRQAVGRHCAGRVSKDITRHDFVKSHDFAKSYVQSNPKTK